MLNISKNEEYFKSDNIVNGRLVQQFFHKIAENVFAQSLCFYDGYKIATKQSMLPLLEGERNIYALFATAIHLSTYLK